MIIFYYLGIKVTFCRSQILDSLQMLLLSCLADQYESDMSKSVCELFKNHLDRFSRICEQMVRQILLKDHFAGGLNLKWTQDFKSASVYYDYCRKILLLLLDACSHILMRVSLYIFCLSLPTPSGFPAVCVDYSPSRPVAGGGDARGSLSRDSSLIFQQHVKSGSPASSDLPCKGRSGNQVTLHSKDAEGHAGDENAISLCLCLYLETRHRQEM